MVLCHCLLSSAIFLSRSTIFRSLSTPSIHLVFGLLRAQWLSGLVLRAQWLSWLVLRAQWLSGLVLRAQWLSGLVLRAQWLSGLVLRAQWLSGLVLRAQWLSWLVLRAQWLSGLVLRAQWLSGLVLRAQWLSGLERKTFDQEIQVRIPPMPHQNMASITNRLVSSSGSFHVHYLPTGIFQWSGLT